MTRFEDAKILIVGLGLIGGSIARGLKRKNPNQPIIACDCDSAQMAAALASQDVDQVYEIDALSAACADADLVVIALPPLATAAILPRLESYCNERAVITDVASVKGYVVAAAEKLATEFSARFVPGHPIAGSEKSGYLASKGELFEGRNIILTPLKNNSSEALRLVTAMWTTLGANMLAMSVPRHDEVLAATSHLPHLLAYSIVDVLAKQERSGDIFRYAAGGFADFSRLASSDARMWSDIFVANRAASADVLGAMITALQALRTALETSPDTRLGTDLHALFSDAKETREAFINTHFNPTANKSMNEKSVVFIAGQSIADQSCANLPQVKGRVRVPGDKSISHRSIIFGAIAEGRTEVSGFLEGEDALNTVAAFRELGVTIVGPENGKLSIIGVGRDGLSAPRKPLYMGNSGTAMRLLSGLLAAQQFDSELTGDESLTKRPMARVVEPLRLMGATIDAQAGGRPPLKIAPAKLHGIRYAMPMASAQVKSCLLLAGLYADGVTEISEPGICRDHTERMLEGFGYPLTRSADGSTVSLEGGHALKATTIDVPSDISSATFFLVAAAICPGSDVVLEHVGINPTRIGVINILKLMGADISVLNPRSVGGEPVAELAIKYAPLHGITIPESQIPLAIDEFPALFIAAATAKGETLLRGAEELRVKESDRLAAMAAGLERIGVDCEMFPDGISIAGDPDVRFASAEIDSEGDHRIAMAFAVASLRAAGELRILNCANVATSFPNFVELSSTLGLEIRVEHV